MAPTRPLSNLDIMKVADAFPYPDKPAEADSYASMMSSLYTLVGPSDQILGYMLPEVVDELLAVPEDIRGPVTVTTDAGDSRGPITTTGRSRRTIRAFCHLPTEPERTALVARVTDYWRKADTFPCLRGWRDELWPVYGGDDRTNPSDLLFSIERSATGLLGAMRYGVHMVGYVKDDGSSSSSNDDSKNNNNMRIWVPRRAANKSTYPNMLDNTVAGGLMTGEDPFECIIREADEEADIPESFMRKNAKFVGTVTYIHITDEAFGRENNPGGQIYPEMQWVYELELPSPDSNSNSSWPKPKDGEVAEFNLLTVDEIRPLLAKGEFKPNCALIEIEFFIRQGVITREEGEKEYDEIVERLHRKLPFPGPHQREG